MDMQWMIVSKLADDGLHEDLTFAILSRILSGRSPNRWAASCTPKGFETGPFADTKRLFFTSNGHGGQGDAEYFHVRTTRRFLDQLERSRQFGTRIEHSRF